MVNTNNKSAFHVTSNTLKYIAIIAMTLDHFAFSFLSFESGWGIFLNIVGMMAAPIFFYSAVEGYHKTRNINKYLARLGIFAIISQFPFTYFVAGGMLPGFNIQNYLFFNVIYTILLGVLAIHVRRKIKNPIIKIIFILCLIIISTPADWGTIGVIIILIFDWFYGNFKKQVLGYCIFTFLLVIPSVGIINVVLNFFVEGKFNLDYLNFSALEQLGMLLPIVPLAFYNGQKGKGGNFTKWFFYIFYPLHLLILGFLSAVL